MGFEIRKIDTVHFDVNDREVIPKVLKCAKEMFPEADVSMRIWGADRNDFIIRGYIEITSLEPGLEWYLSLTVHLYYRNENIRLVAHEGDGFDTSTFVPIEDSDDLRAFLTEMITMRNEEATRRMETRKIIEGDF